MEPMHSRRLTKAFRAPEDEGAWPDSGATRPSGVSVDISQLWPDLVGGKKVILQCSSMEFPGLLTLTDVAPEARTGTVSGRTLEIVERVLLGDAHKVIASDHDLSCSTITATATAVLQRVGLSRVGSRAPLILCSLVFAHQNGGVQGLSRAVRAVRVANLTFVMLERPDRLLTDKVSPAEVDILQMRAEGMTHAQIAARRKTSKRTIANQLASAWRKLGISGRNELIRYLLRQAH
jgi:DNA-binding NarL/FixJ family response regulator